MRDDLFRLLEAMTERVRADAAELEMDADDYLGRVWVDVDAFSRRIGLSGPPVDGDPTSGSPSEPSGAPAAGPPAEPPNRVPDPEKRHAERHANDTERHANDPERHADAEQGGAYHKGRHVERHGSEICVSQNTVSACVGCVLALICGRRLALARA